jgi:hypothetical protein
MYDPSIYPALLDITAALGRGWFVNVPDYEGPLAAELEGAQYGHATLDSVRAVLEFTISHHGLGLRLDTKYALWGYSGGGIASEWAAELQESYAPDLNFAGLVAGGLAPNVETSIGLVTGTEFAGLIPSGLLGLTVEFPEARDFLVSRLKTTGPYNATTFLSALSMSFEEASQAFALQNISNYFVNGDADIYAPILQALYNSQGVMGEHGVPRMPAFVYKAIADEIGPVAETDELVDKFCRLGANILYERNTVGEHVSEYQNGHTRSLDWLSSIFNGTYEAHGCTVLNVSVVDPSGPIVG